MAGKVIRTVAVKVRADVSDFEKNMIKAQKAMTNVANKMKSIGKNMTTTITLPLVAVGAAATKMAMSYENSMKQIENNLGSSSKAVKDWVNNNAQSLNMAKVDASKFAATYSNLLSGFLDNSQNADFTKALLQQSSVVANKTGRTIDDVMERIRSGLLGNTESIEDLGINVNVALLQTTDAFKKIASNKSWDKLSFQAQQQIRLFAILEQSMKKYGTTLDQSASSSMQGMIAKAKDLALSIGQKLLPYVIKLLDQGNKFLDWLNNMDPAMQENIIRIAGLAAAAGPLLLVTGNLTNGMSSLVGVVKAIPAPVAIATGAIGVMTAGLIVLYNKNEDFHRRVNETWAVTAQNIQTITQNIDKFLSKFGTNLDSLGNRIQSGIVSQLNILLNRIQLVSGALGDLSEGNFKGAIKKVGQVWWEATAFGQIKAFLDSGERKHGGGGGSFGQSWSAGQIYAEKEKEKYNAKSSASTNWLNGLMDGFKGLGDAGTETYDKLNDSVKSFIDSLKSQTDAYMNFVGVFDSANNDMVVSGERWISRLKGQLKATQTYQQSIAFLQGKAQSGVISNQLMSQLQSMGVGSAAQLQALTKMSDSQLRQASDLYGQRYNLSSDMAYDSVMKSRGSEAATNQIIVNITGNNILTEDDAVINKWSKKIAKELKAAGMA